LDCSPPKGLPNALLDGFPKIPPLLEGVPKIPPLLEGVPKIPPLLDGVPKIPLPLFDEAPNIPPAFANPEPPKILVLEELAWVSVIIPSSLLFLVNPLFSPNIPPPVVFPAVEPNMLELELASNTPLPPKIEVGAGEP